MDTNMDDETCALCGLKFVSTAEGDWHLGGDAERQDMDHQPLIAGRYYVELRLVHEDGDLASAMSVPAEDAEVGLSIFKQACQATLSNRYPAAYN